MILKHLINPKPTIIIFFVVFYIFFTSIPLFFNKCSSIFSHNTFSCSFVFILSLIIPFFHALGLNNLVYEKNIIKKDNLVLGVVYVLLCTPFFNSINEWIISFALALIGLATLKLR